MMGSQLSTDENPAPRYSIEQVRALFPCLQQEIHGHPLVYLDSAATTQKPQPVIEAIDHFYRHDYSNVHRGVHTLSERATSLYEGVRAKVANLIHATDPHEVVFTRGTTEGINLVARTIGRSLLNEGDEVLISAMEHHANIVPWQMICKEQGAILKVIPCDDDGDLILDDLDTRIGPRTRVVAVGYVSNALGTVHDVKKIITEAQKVGAITLIDAAQAVAHIPIDVVELGCDFLVFSAHKMYGPSGSGVLWGRKELLDQMEPWQGGGDMIRTVSFEGSTYAETPWKFEAGTPHIAGVIGLGAAVDFLQDVGVDCIDSHESPLLAETVQRFDQVNGLRVIGRPTRRVSVISFLLDDIHPHDMGTIIDQYGVAVRAGHHCAMPLMDRFGISATVRVSYGIYNCIEEIDSLMLAIEKVREVFR